MPKNAATITVAGIIMNIIGYLLMIFSPFTATAVGDTQPLAMMIMGTIAVITGAVLIVIGVHRMLTALHWLVRRNATDEERAAEVVRPIF